VARLRELAKAFLVSAGVTLGLGAAAACSVVVFGMVLGEHHSPVLKREAVLREDLWILRDSINRFFSDHGRYPDSLAALVEAGSIKSIPVDPITNSAETWITEHTEPDPVHPDAPAGIRDVRSGATGTTVQGVPYSEL